MRWPRLMAVVVIVPVVCTCLLLPEREWMKLQFVWGSPRIEIQQTPS